MREHDCVPNVRSLRDWVNDGEVVASLGERILGRVAADDVKRPGTEEIVVAAGQLIDERMADAIEEAGVQSMRIRSPLTVKAKRASAPCAMAVTLRAVPWSLREPSASSRRSPSVNPVPS